MPIPFEQQSFHHSYLFQDNHLLLPLDKDLILCYSNIQNFDQYEPLKEIVSGDFRPASPYLVAISPEREDPTDLSLLVMVKLPSLMFDLRQQIQIF